MKVQPLTFYHQKQNKDCQTPSGPAFVAALKACVNKQDLENGRKMHAYATEVGFLEENKFIGSIVVHMYAKCNCLPDARRVFDMLEDRDVVSWTAIIGGYAENGDEQAALLCLEKMQHAGVTPNSVTYISSLKACSIIQQMTKGQEIHCEVERLGLLEQELNLGNSLVDMYAKCGCFCKAHEVFDRLPMHNAITWTALVGGYVEYSCHEEALKCLEAMKENKIDATSVTLMCGLKACGGMKSLNKGREIHSQIEKDGWFENDAEVGNALIDMYAKCGVLAKAHQVFDTMSMRNKVSWSCLINGCAEVGLADRAISLFKQMQSLGISPDAVTYVCFLKACGRIGALAEGLDAHAEIERRGLFEASVVGNSLVHMYGKCDSVTKAEEVFDALSVRNLVSWNALLSGYVDGGHAEEVIQSFEKMQLEGISPDAITFVCSLKACGELGIIKKGIEIHGEIERKCFLETNLGIDNTGIDNTLVHMYSRCGFLGRARDVFNKIPSKNVVSWNALISGYAEQGDDEQAIFLSEQMQSKGVFPDVVTYMCLLKACSCLGAREQVRKIHEELERRNLVEESLDVSNTLIDSYAKCGLLGMARHAFNAMKAVDCVSWNALISGYTRDEHNEEAVTCFKQMQSRGFPPDSVTFIWILKALASMGILSEGQDIHAEIERRGLLDGNIVVGSTLIDMYAKCGILSKARSIFDQLSSRGVVAWTVLMSGYAQLGQSQHVFSLFDKMIAENVDPDMVAFVIVLSACSRRGLFDKSQMYYEMMSEKYGILPSLEHQVCIMDGLGRIGELDKAHALLMKLSVRPNLMAWHAFLVACAGWGSRKTGKQAFCQILCLNE